MSGLLAFSRQLYYIIIVFGLWINYIEGGEGIVQVSNEKTNRTNFTIKQIIPKPRFEMRMIKQSDTEPYKINGGLPNNKNVLNGTVAKGVGNARSSSSTPTVELVLLSKTSNKILSNSTVIKGKRTDTYSSTSEQVYAKLLTETARVTKSNVSKLTTGSPSSKNSKRKQQNYAKLDKLPKTTTSQRSKGKTSSYKFYGHSSSSFTSTKPTPKQLRSKSGQKRPTQSISIKNISSDTTLVRRSSTKSNKSLNKLKSRVKATTPKVRKSKIRKMLTPRSTSPKSIGKSEKSNNFTSTEPSKQARPLNGQKSLPDSRNSTRKSRRRNAQTQIESSNQTAPHEHTKMSQRATLKPSTPINTAKRVNRNKKTPRNTTTQLLQKESNPSKGKRSTAKKRQKLSPVRSTKTTTEQIFRPVTTSTKATKRRRSTNKSSNQRNVVGHNKIPSSYINGEISGRSSFDKSYDLYSTKKKNQSNKNDQKIFPTEQILSKSQNKRITRGVIVEWKLLNGELIINETPLEDEIAPRMMGINENVTEPQNTETDTTSSESNTTTISDVEASTTIEYIINEVTPLTEIVSTLPSYTLNDNETNPENATEGNDILASELVVNLIVNNTSTVKSLLIKEMEREEEYKHESLFARILRFIDKKAAFQYYGFTASVRIRDFIISSGCIINEDTVLSVIGTHMDVKKDWIVSHTLNTMEFSVRVGKEQESVIEDSAKIIPHLKGFHSPINGSLIILIKVRHLFEFGQTLYAANINNTRKKHTKMVVVEWQRGRYEMGMDIPINLIHYSVGISRKCSSWLGNITDKIICIKRPPPKSGSNYCGRLGSLLVEKKTQNVLGILTHPNCNQTAGFTPLHKLTEWIYDQVRFD